MIRFPDSIYNPWVRWVIRVPKHLSPRPSSLGLNSWSIWVWAVWVKIKGPKKYYAVQSMFPFTDIGLHFGCPMFDHHHTVDGNQNPFLSFFFAFAGGTESETRVSQAVQDFVHNLRSP